MARGTLRKKKGSNLYGGTFKGGENGHECNVYIGGDYYNDGAQVHLTWAEAERLASWLTQLVDRHKSASARNMPTGQKL